MALESGKIFGVSPSKGTGVRVIPDSKLIAVTIINLRISAFFLHCSLKLY